jgi:hypothetical protein
MRSSVKIKFHCGKHDTPLTPDADLADGELHKCVTRSFSGKEEYEFDFSWMYCSKGEASDESCQNTWQTHLIF